MHQLLDQPTRVDNKNSSMLDVILTSHPTLHRNNAVLKYTQRDHYLIYIQMDFKNMRSSQHCKISRHEKFRYKEFLPWSDFVWYS